MKSSQKGFGVVEIILVVMVVGLLGAVGYLTLTRQSNTATQTPQSTVTPNTEAPSAVADIDEAVSKLEAKIIELSQDRYEYEMLTGNVSTELEIDATTTLSTQKANNVYFRTDPWGYKVGSTSEDYDYEVYKVELAEAAGLVNAYAVNTLGLTKTYDYKVQGQTGDTIATTIYKVGSYYLGFQYGDTGNFYLAWAEAK